MASYRVSADAKSDLRDIYRYSFKNHGEAQADKYLESLYDVFDTIGNNPEIGLLPKFDTDSQLRKFPALKHIIFYKISISEVEIRRIFHSSRDIKNLDMKYFQ